MNRLIRRIVLAAASLGLVGSVGATCYVQVDWVCCSAMQPAWLKPKCNTCPGVFGGCCQDSITANDPLSWTRYAWTNEPGVSTRLIDDEAVYCKYRMNMCVDNGVGGNTCSLSSTESSYPCYAQSAPGTTNCHGTGVP